MLLLTVVIAPECSVANPGFMPETMCMLYCIHLVSILLLGNLLWEIYSTHSTYIQKRTVQYQTIHLQNNFTI